MPKNKLKNGCGPHLFGMYKWLPDFCFKQSCNIHDIEFTRKGLSEANFNFLENMVYSIYQYGKYKILLSFVAIIYYLAVVLFGWIFYYEYRLRTKIKSTLLKKSK